MNCGLVAIRGGLYTRLCTLILPGKFPGTTPHKQAGLFIDGGGAAFKMAVALKQSYLRSYSLSNSSFTCSLRSYFSFMRYYSSCSFPPGPGLKDFIKEREFRDMQLSGTAPIDDDHSPPPYLNEETIAGRNRKGIEKN